MRLCLVYHPPQFLGGERFDEGVIGAGAVDQESVGAAIEQEYQAGGSDVAQSNGVSQGSDDGKTSHASHLEVN